MQFNIQEILDRFSQKSRVLVLLILVIAISGTWIFHSYMKSGSYSCGDIIKENFALQESFAKMSRLARELQEMKVAEQAYLERSNSMYEVDSDTTDGMEIPAYSMDPEQAIIDEMLELTERPIKTN